jgi:hypothetical protein
VWEDHRLVSGDAGHSLLMPPGSITMTSIPNGAEDVDLELVASLVHWDVLERAI